ncbi:DUF4097 family beta strand repeat-containing protein [Paenibacillus gansuensis]|uniref:DUF4097 family beta strand repeat-containing protein n=1 Tax=Paenibacillus gansuensis TaxID=306542 RepID=A0ABW5PF70_9BACL
MKTGVKMALLGLVIGLAGTALTINKGDMFTFRTEPVSLERIVEHSKAVKAVIVADSADMKIIPAEGDRVKVSIAGKVSLHQADRLLLTAEESGDTLTIRADWKDQFVVGVSMAELDMTVELPKRVYDSFKLRTDSGNAVITGVQADSMEVDSDSGKVTVEDSQAEKLLFDGDSSTMSFVNVLADLKGTTDSGDVVITGKQWDRTAEVKTDSGDVTVTLSEQPQSMRIQYTTDSGKQQLDFDGIMRDDSQEGNYQAHFGSGEKKFEVNTDSGDFTFRQQ